MRYKIIKNKIIKVYEYYHEDIDMCKGLTEVGDCRYIAYINYSIRKRYVKDRVENVVKYIECDYNITRGDIVDGVTIEKVEIDNGKVTLYSTYTSDKIEIIGKSKEQIEEDMRKEFLKEFEEIKSKYVYIDVINNIIDRRRHTKCYVDYDNYIPYYVCNYISNYRNVWNILSYFYRVKHEDEDYTKTPLEMYALQRMEINYRRDKNNDR